MSLREHQRKADGALPAAMDKLWEARQLIEEARGELHWVPNVGSSYDRLTTAMDQISLVRLTLIQKETS